MSELVGFDRLDRIIRSKIYFTVPYYKNGKHETPESHAKMTDANQAKMDVNLKEMREEIKSGQAEMRSTVNAFQEKTDA
jgi:hypothetical protein